ncbi:MAG: MFS transporter [Bacillota bacterium]
MEKDSPSTQNSARITVTLLVVLMVFFDMFSQLPIISPYASSLGAGIFVAGLSVSMYSLTNMIGNLYSGKVISRIGRVTAISAGMLVAAAAIIGYTLVSSPGEFLFLRAIHGLGISVVVPAAYAYLGSFVSSDHRGKEMAKTGIAIGVAALIGPAFGGIIKDRLGEEFVFLIIAASLLVTSLLVRWILRDYRSTTTKEDEAVPLISLLRRRGLLSAYVAAFSLMFAKGTLAFSLPLYVETLGYSSMITGVLFSSFALAALIVFITPLNRLSDRLGRERPLQGGLFLIGCALLLLLLSGNLSYMLAIMFLYGAGFGLLFPTATALVLDHTNSTERSTAFGLFYGVFSLGVVTGPVLGGFAATWGISPFLVGGTAALLGVLYLVYLGTGSREISRLEE